MTDHTPRHITTAPSARPAYTPVTHAPTTPRDTRRMARTYRRHHRTYGPSPVARVIGWLALAVFVACAAGVGAVEMNRHLVDDIGPDRPTVSTPTDGTWDVPTTDPCPTVDSCDKWGVPYVP